MKILLKNGKIIAHDNVLKSVNLMIEEGRIQSIKENILDEADEVFDLKGALIVPGLVDVHVHLREPGFEYKETIATGTRAAAHGGYTTICAMPNLAPAPDSVAHLAIEQNRIEKSALVKVLPYASITKNRTSDELVDFAALAAAGAFAFSNDGSGVQTTETMYQAMRLAVSADRAICAHIEDKSLMKTAVMREGKHSRELGLLGMPAVTESAQLARDLALAEATGVHYHACHLSTKTSVRLIREAKRAGINVTAEVCPHHLLLCDEDIPADNANYKMNPPLPQREDREALIAGLLDGTIDCIATDHAPHSLAEKAAGFQQSAFGIVGIEQAFSLIVTHFVETGLFTLEQVVNWMSLVPARLFGIKNEGLTVGAVADIAVFDLNQDYKIETKDFESKGINTPFIGQKVKGQTVMTLVEGKIVWQQNSCKNE